MSNARKQDSIEDGMSNSDGFNDSSSVADASISTSAETSGDGSAENSSVSRDNGSSRSGEVGLTERLTEILVDEGDGDLMIQQNDRGIRVLQWLQALDMHVMGACRVDERLKPLLKLSVSSGVAEDRLLSHLSQHFEPSEVGILARCLCIPLVSIRVGKNVKQGTRLCPTAIRGNLDLMLLPTSDLRMSFIGDDGHTEKLCTLSSSSQCSAAVIEEISADNSGRSFLVKIPDNEVVYFWCSEKSMLLGKELLAKMKDLLARKPSLAELTGISEACLDCFAAHLRAYLVGSAVSKTRSSLAESSTSSAVSTPDFCEVSQNAQSLFPCSKPMRYRQNGNPSMKSNSLYQGSLSPRSSSFKEGLPRTLSSLRIAVREKLRRRGDNLTAIDDLPVANSITAKEACSSYSFENEKELARSHALPPSSFLESLGKSVALTPLSSVSLVTPLASPLPSPCYCWCPPRASTLQYTVAPSQLSLSSSEALFLPPLSSFLPATRSSSLLTSSSPLNLTDVTSLGLPAFMPDPFVRLPFSMPSSQQIPTFTPLMCDPIVHIPVIQVCSSGQGYLVSAGPAMSTSIPSLHPKLVNPLIPDADSLIENGARETLRMLINGTNQTNPQLMNVVLPTALTNSGENQSLLLVGSRGLYSGTSDIDAIANSIAAFRVVSHSGRSEEASVRRTCSDKDDLDSQPKQSSGLDGFSSNVVSDSSNPREKSI